MHAKLAAFLSNMSWEVEAVSTATPFSSSSSDGDSGGDSGVVDGGVIRVHTQGSMYTFYENYLRKFGELLTDMERNGIKVIDKLQLRFRDLHLLLCRCPSAFSSLFTLIFPPL